MNFLKRIYFIFFTHLIVFVAKLLGGIHGPWTHKRTSQQDVEDILPLIEEGDFILTRTRGELTTAVIPGYWKHSETYVGERHVVGAVSPQTRKTWIENLILKTDYFCVMRLKDVTKEEQQAICAMALAMLHIPYDFGMNFNEKSTVCCSELIFLSINHARPGTLDLRPRMGFKTITPQDIADATSKFDVIYKKIN